MVIDSKKKKKIAIVGGGIGGLVLALALKKNLSSTNDNDDDDINEDETIQLEVYEQSPAYKDGVGGAIGMYANGLRVIKDISPKLLSKLLSEGYPYIYRRWYRHDGTEVACAKENLLTPTRSDDDELMPLGIRRWKLQKALYEACVEQNIPIHFNKHVKSVIEEEEELDGDNANQLKTTVVKLEFADNTTTIANYVFGADGVKSKVRNAVLGEENAEKEEPIYTGVTCLMGAAPIPRPVRGICFPSSQTTKCHMCTYPTSDNESIFQLYFPTPVENPEEWGALTESQSKDVCDDLVKTMIDHGWDDQFINLLRNAEPSSLVRVGLRAREPVSKWVNNNMVLLGDAAHPPVPYIGQGAMMAIEDAGTIALLLKKYCCSSSIDAAAGNDDDDTFDINFKKAMNVYEEVRIPRTTAILEASHELGKTQQRRATDKWYNFYREMMLKYHVTTTGTLPTMKRGSMFDYKGAVDLSKLEIDE